jgi:hypothetical protein
MDIVDRINEILEENYSEYLHTAGKSFVTGASGAVGAAVGGSAALIAGEKIRRMLNKKKKKTKEKK